jgi:plastocyanin
MLGITSVAVRATSPLPSPTHRSQANLRQSMTNLLAKIVALGALVLLLEPSHSLAADAEVKIANFTFDPLILTVKAGTTMTWVNGDDIPHVVSEKNGAFRSSALDTSDAFTQTFPTAGTIEYFCAIHPHMTGKIIVTP